MQNSSGGATGDKKHTQKFEHVQGQSQSVKPLCREHASRPTENQISTRAYELYVAGGSAKGHCKDNWFRAEKELAEEPGASSPMKS